MPLAYGSDFLLITVEVKANDNTFINVGIVDSIAIGEYVIQIQCVDTGDLYSRSVFYSTALIIISINVCWYCSVLV